jgi:hypothetical protein
MMAHSVGERGGERRREKGRRGASQKLDGKI